MLNVTLVPILEDNYAYIIQSGDAVAVIDPGEADGVIHVLEKLKLEPQFIFNTHHHSDHVDGNKTIKDKYDVQILGPEKEAGKIPFFDKGFINGDVFQFGDEAVQIIETAGHTAGHICFYFLQSQTLFSGDALFSMGCGRLFEGTAEQLFEYMQRLKQLPDSTKIYCGHEYTEANANFCLSIYPDNKSIFKRAEEVQELRNKNQPTIPTTIEQEKKTNVFFMAKDAEEMKKFRGLKDNY